MIELDTSAVGGQSVFNLPYMDKHVAFPPPLERQNSKVFEPVPVIHFLFFAFLDPSCEVPLDSLNSGYVSNFIGGPQRGAVFKLLYIVFTNSIYV